MNAEAIARRLSECGLSLPETVPQQLAVYHALLLDWNTRMDLTAVTDEADMLDRHYVDSLAALRFPGLLPEGTSLIDVGTGAGFPGLPLAIARPDLQVCLLDAQQKRLNFLACVIDALGLQNVTLLHARAEDAARDKVHREHYDLAVARAVAPLSVLSEYLLPFVKVGGRALCWKGPALVQEIEAGRRAAFLLGAQAEEPLPYCFPGTDRSPCLQPLHKLKPTPRTYPRKAGIPAKQPLGTAPAPQNAR